MHTQSFTKMLELAQQEHFTVGGFNVVNMETIQAVINAAEKTNSPVIVQVYHDDLGYAGAEYIVAIAEAAAKSAHIPVCLSLDHGESYEQALHCIEAGFSGVMIDLSKEDLQANIYDTKRVVKVAHSKGVSVEAELGKILDATASYEEINSGMTDPKVAQEFVEKTGIDSLAVSIGTAHGFYSSKPEINYHLLQELLDIVPIPIVVHGGSDTPDDDIMEIVRLGVSKINIGTDLMKAFNQALFDSLSRGGTKQAPRDVLTIARNSVENVVLKKLDLLNKFRNSQ